MTRPARTSALLPVLLLAGCLLPGRREPTASGEAGFLQDYSLLRPAQIVRQAYLKPGTQLRGYRAVRIPDFENYSGRPVDPEALRLVAEAVAASLQSLPPDQRPFLLLDRSPRDAAGWVDLQLLGAVTEYEVKTDSSSWNRLRDQAVVAVECRLVETRGGGLVAQIQHRTRAKIEHVQYQNPVRSAIDQLGHDIAAWLANPVVKAREERP
jgi:hypothetical protein